MNQTILLNHGVLDIVFDLLNQEVDSELLVLKYIYLFVLPLSTLIHGHLTKDQEVHVSDIWPV